MVLVVFGARRMARLVFRVSCQFTREEDRYDEEERTSLSSYVQMKKTSSWRSEGQEVHSETKSSCSSHKGVRSMKVRSAQNILLLRD